MIHWTIEWFVSQKLELEIQDLSLPATVWLPRLDDTYVHMIRHPKAYRLTYHDWHHLLNEKYWIPTFIFFGIPNFGIGIPISWFFNSGIWLKIFRPESSESETDPEFRFWWGSQKSEPKIGIPNQDGGDTAKSVCSLSRGRVPDSSPWIVFCLFFTTTVQCTEQPSVRPRIVQAVQNPVSPLTLYLLHSSKIPINLLTIYPGSYCTFCQGKPGQGLQWL